jgi:mannose-6-phosphate isomerase-like protein (cupin superfamily)
MLSKIERGQVFPTLPTLLRIALVFGVGLEHFFVEAAERPTLAVVRKGERLRLPERPGEPNPSYLFESLDFPATERLMDAYLAEFPAGAPRSQPHRHAGAEFVFVLDGRLAVEVDETRVELGEGDALYFDSGVPHAYGAAGEEGASALVVVSEGRARAAGAERV